MRSELSAIPLGASGWGGIVIGLIIFVVAGIAALAAGFPAGVVPALFSLVGLSIAGYRWRSELLCEAGRIDEHHRFFIFAWTSVKQIGSLQRVLIGRPETRGSGKNRRTVYPVRLGGATALHELGVPQDALAARRLGEEWAKRLELPLADSSSGSESVREHQQLDQPAIERMELGDLAVAPPPTLRTVMREVDGSIEITQRNDLGRAIGIAVLLAIATAIASVAIAIVVGGQIAMLIIIALVISDVVVFAVLFANGAFSRRLVVTPRSGLRLGGQGMTVEELEELVVGDGPTRLRAISDRKVLEFGRGLPVEELTFLRAIILKTLKGPG
ncbi:MAG TPA: hypothetical protein DCS97_02235 [Planctomycetes bacterium]|nr:hypothetical protein [Planctomycetota bacterium]